MAAIAGEIAALKARQAELETEWAAEKALVDEIRDLHDLQPPITDGAKLQENSSALAQQEVSGELREQLRRKFEMLQGRSPEQRMVYACVDEHVGRLGGFRLDRHSGRPHGEG